jgi:hypothetical protein
MNGNAQWLNVLAVAALASLAVGQEGEAMTFGTPSWADAPMSYTGQSNPSEWKQRSAPKHSTTSGHTTNQGGYDPTQYPGGPPEDPTLSAASDNPMDMRDMGEGMADTMGYPSAPMDRMMNGGGDNPDPYGSFGPRGPNGPPGMTRRPRSGGYYGGYPNYPGPNGPTRGGWNTPPAPTDPYGYGDYGPSPYGDPGQSRSGAYPGTGNPGYGGTGNPGYGGTGNPGYGGTAPWPSNPRMPPPENGQGRQYPTDPNYGASPPSYRERSPAGDPSWQGGGAYSPDTPRDWRHWGPPQRNNNAWGSWNGHRGPNGPGYTPQPPSPRDYYPGGNADGWGNSPSNEGWGNRSAPNLPGPWGWDRRPRDPNGYPDRRQSSGPNGPDMPGTGGYSPYDRWPTNTWGMPQETAPPPEEKGQRRPPIKRGQDNPNPFTHRGPYATTPTGEQPASSKENNEWHGYPANPITPGTAFNNDAASSPSTDKTTTEPEMKPPAPLDTPPPGEPVGKEAPVTPGPTH